jgi:uncharacterized protein
MRVLLTLPLGLLIGVALGSLGGGGSILAVPALVYGVGLGARQAITTSLVMVGISALAGLLSHLRHGQVQVSAGLWFGITGVGGSLLGSRLNRAIDPQVLLLVFSFVMLAAAWRMWATARRSSPAVAPAVRGTGGGPAPSPPRAPGLLHGAVPDEDRRSRLALVAGFVAAGTVVGFLTGFFGVGGGFVIVPALVLVLRFDMVAAVGTSLLVIAINSATALATRLATTGVAWHVALPFAVAGMVGAVAGHRLTRRAPSATLVRWFIVLLVSVAVYTLARSAAAL